MGKVERIIITLKLPKDEKNNLLNNNSDYESIKRLILENSSADWDARDISVQANSTLLSLLDYMGLDENNAKCYSQNAMELVLNGSFISNQLFNGSTLYIISKE
jgi:hypothetical protein